MVAIPGTLCAPEVFSRVAGLLEGRVRVRAVDWMLGEGPCRVENVAERIAATLDRPVLLAGHSTGGAIALRLADRHPGLVSGLLLIDTGAHMHGHGDVDKIIETVTTGWGPGLISAVLDRSFARPLPPEERADFLAYAEKVPQDAVLAALTSQRDLDLTPVLSGLTCPVTVLHGEQDGARPIAQAREMAAAIPGALFRAVPTGHTPVWEDPETSAEVIRELAARIG
ncbi:alpha/beta fold hydrolase [Amycolatopsis acidicola]|uniref:Alpha/beta fold hydrolase n=1 Tax=Amycolatopsis acidicola TaxID=2596893 RepID=A0A5N0UK16_9PSEU|nr:alpha/beta fold hydrolase [Amycolatopsis acidicola]